MTDHVRSDISNGVLTLTLNRPEKKNALTRDMYQALGDGIDGAGQNDEIDGRGQLTLIMPDDRRLEAADSAQRSRRVRLAIGAGKKDDGGAHSAPGFGGKQPRVAAL